MKLSLRHVSFLALAAWLISAEAGIASGGSTVPSADPADQAALKDIVDFHRVIPRGGDIGHRPPAVQDDPLGALAGGDHVDDLHRPGVEDRDGVGIRIGDQPGQVGQHPARGGQGKNRGDDIYEDRCDL